MAENHDHYVYGPAEGVIFLDTGFLFALVSKRDAHYDRVVEVFREFQNRRLQDYLLTTNHVIAEAITLTLKVGHDEAVKLGNQLYGEKLARIHCARVVCPSRIARHSSNIFASRMSNPGSNGVVNMSSFSSSSSATRS